MGSKIRIFDVRRHRTKIKRPITFQIAAARVGYQTFPRFEPEAAYKIKATKLPWWKSNRS
jgi:hypothetical protein